MKRYVQFGLVVCLVLSSVASANLLVNVNWQEYPPAETKSGAAAIGQAGDYWNQCTASWANTWWSLKDANGANTSIQCMKTNADNWQSDNNGNPQDDMFRGWALGMQTKNTLTIKGLDASKTYDLYLYSVDCLEPYTLTFEINGVQKKPNEGTIYLTSFVENENYVVFRGLSGSTQIACDYWQDNSQDPYATSGPFDGWQLAEVPEPVTISLLLLGFGLIRRRRS